MAPDGIEDAEIRAALLRLRRATGLPVAFGGPLEAGGRQMRIRQLSGTGTASLSSLVVSTGSGLGGKVIALTRPCAVTDYHVSRAISHEYDTAVAAEGLRSVLAVPVVVRRRVRAVLYGALRAAQPLGQRALDAAMAAARDVEQALAVRDEVASLLASAREPSADARAWEQVREAHGTLRSVAGRISDPELRAEVLAVCEQLSAGASGAGERVGVALAPREVDVLSCVAAGCTNAAAAEQLGLRPETVKAYLRSAMRKLGAHTRMEAVVLARRGGALP